MAEIFAAAAITIEAVEDLRYGARHLIGRPDFAGKILRR